MEFTTPTKSKERESAVESSMMSGRVITRTGSSAKYRHSSSSCKHDQQSNHRMKITENEDGNGFPCNGGIIKEESTPKVPFAKKKLSFD
jgi:hypothetical protein